MKPRISLITLGVDDLERSLVFYRDGLGLVTPGIVGEEFEHGAVVFLDLQPGLFAGAQRGFAARGGRRDGRGRESRRRDRQTGG